MKRQYFIKTYLGEETYKALERACKDLCCSKSFLLRFALNSYLSKKGYFTHEGR